MPLKPPKPLRPPPDELVGSSVLVVDDERVWRLILETDLTLLGYRVAMAHDADEALSLARTEGPEVAIIDLMLPDPVDGWALLDKLRAQGTPVPVIFYTAYPAFPSEPEDPQVIGYMSKAADRADLYALLPGAILENRRRRPGPAGGS